ncbi:small ribosomal subunit protein uS5m-like [Bolinopsis microptera]|uniref:small ribosomal subunit protein uS5m-like n=1 Tax=Bolinopsis microptera TaxID=2820187 RepID=UPI00307A8455
MAKRLFLHVKNSSSNPLIIRLLSRAPDSSPKTSLYAHNGKSDETGYRIPLLQDDEHQLFYSTDSDQWKFGIRSKAPKFRNKATAMDIYPKTNIQPIENFNYKRFDKTQRASIRKFSEFYDCMPHHQLSDVTVQRLPRVGDIKNSLRAQKSADMYDSFSGRGWSHTNGCGESFGPPRKLLPDGSLDVDSDTRFNSKILQLDYREKLFSKGKQAGMRICVAVGNGKGLLGVGITFHPRLREGLIEAKEYAYRQLVHFPMTETGSIPYATRGRYHRTELHAIPTSSDQDNKAQRVVKELLDLAGYKNVAVKMYGRNSVESLVKAFFVTFQNFESHQQQADRLGRYVVQFDPETYFMPSVLAKPRDDSKPVPFSAEIHESSQRLK